jgi:hypothetical protein
VAVQNRKVVQRHCDPGRIGVDQKKFPVCINGFAEPVLLLGEVRIPEAILCLVLVELPCLAVAFHGVAPGKAQVVHAAEFGPILRQLLYLTLPLVNLGGFQPHRAIEVARLQERGQGRLFRFCLSRGDILHQLDVLADPLLFVRARGTRLFLRDALFVFGALELLLLKFEDSLRALVDPPRGGYEIRKCGAGVILKTLLNGNPGAVMLRERDQVAKAGLQRHRQAFAEQLQQRIGHRAEAVWEVIDRLPPAAAVCCARASPSSRSMVRRKSWSSVASVPFGSAGDAPGASFAAASESESSGIAPEPFNRRAQLSNQPP